MEREESDFLIKALDELTLTPDIRFYINTMLETSPLNTLTLLANIYAMIKDYIHRDTTPLVAESPSGSRGTGSFACKGSDCRVRQFEAGGGDVFIRINKLFIFLTHNDILFVSFESPFRGHSTATHNHKEKVKFENNYSGACKYKIENFIIKI
jgi:hypothetical protein